MLFNYLCRLKGSAVDKEGIEEEEEEDYSGDGAEELRNPSMEATKGEEDVGGTKDVIPDSSYGKSVEEIGVVVQKLIDERRRNEEALTEEECLQLSSLLSQLKGLNLKKDDNYTDITEDDGPTKTEPHPCSPPQTAPEEENHNCETNSVSDVDKIVGELNRVRRQNTITHCLLSALIVVTAVWQLSEVSLLLQVKNKVAHPMRAIGSFVSGALLGGGKMKQLENISASDKTSGAPDLPALPRISVPELPHVRLPSLDLTGIEDG